MKRIAAIAGIVAALIAGVTFLGTSKSAEGPSVTGAAGSGGGAPPARGAQAIPVLAAGVSLRGMQQVLDVTGSLKTDEEVQIGSRIAGKVVGVPVREGARVARGQLLVRLDDRELKAQLARARALLAAARARLSLAGNQAVWKDEAARSEHARAQASLRAAQARVQQAETNARITATTTQKAVETAQSGVRVATERLSIVKDLTRKQELRQIQLAVEQARAELSQSRVDVDNARQMLERRQKLYSQDAVAREEVDEADRRHKAQQARVRVAEAALAVQEQKLELAQEGSRPEEVRIAEGQLRAAERALEVATSDLGKQQVAAEEVAAAKALEEQARAAVQSASAGLVQSKMSQDDIAAANASIAQARADIQYYEAQLADLSIYSPVAGVVSARHVNVGEMVTTSTPLMTIVALNAVYLEAVVPELEISQVKAGAPAAVTVDALPGRSLTGTVREVIPVADRTSRAFRVRIAVPGGRGELPAGGYARARVDVGRRGRVVSVRKDAILTEAGDKFVWLIEGDGKGSLVARRRVITVGLVDATHAEILTGLEAGQQVVAAGSPSIVEGTPVSVAGG